LRRRPRTEERARREENRKSGEAEGLKRVFQRFEKLNDLKPGEEGPSLGGQEGGARKFACAGASKLVDRSPLLVQLILRAVRPIISHLYTQSLSRGKRIWDPEGHWGAVKVRK